MNLEFIKKVNLVEQLSDAHPHIGELAEEDIAAWDEDQIRAHYSETLASTVSARREEGTTVANADKSDSMTMTANAD